MARSMNRPFPTYRLYGENGGQSEDFWLHCETIPERSRLHDWEIKPHRHEAFFQFLYISHGQGEALIDAFYRPFGPETAIFVPPGPVHGFRFSRDIGGLVITILRDRLDSVAATDRHVAYFASAARMVALEAAADARIIKTFQRIADELAARNSGRMMLLGALVTDAIVSLSRMTPASNDAPATHSDRNHQRMEQLAILISSHCKEHRPVEFYASKIGVSPAHLNRLTRKAAKKSVQELMFAELVERAKRELVFTFLPAQSIALGLGFTDPAYFSRFFRNETGRTPGEYRTSEREKLKF